MVKGPTAVADVTVSVKVPELPALILIEADVIPVGRFFGVTVTEPVNPFSPFTEAWTLPELPRATCKEVGYIETEKSGVAGGGGGGVGGVELAPPPQPANVRQRTREKCVKKTMLLRDRMWTSCPIQALQIARWKWTKGYS
jgi:hypothetical protein